MSGKPLCAPALLAAASLLAAFPSPPALAQPLQVGERYPFEAASPHPYPAGGGARPVWDVRVDHPGATYISVHFDRFELGPGDRVVVRSEDGVQRHAFTGRGKGDLGAFWATHIKGDVALVELFAPGAGAGAWGVSIDEYAAGFADPWTESTGGIESVCSGDDRQPAMCYVTTEPEIYERSRAVARLLIEGTFFCTGWLVGCQGHLMTNNHCIDDPELSDPAVAVVNTDYEFMAEAPTCSGGCGGQLCFPGDVWGGAASLVQRAVSHDYAFLLLAGNPQNTYGFFRLLNRLPVANERIYIPQHGGGLDKRVAAFSLAPQDESGFCEVASASTSPCGFPGEPPNVGYFCDTEPGTSGSPVVAYSSHDVIGLHHCAGCPNKGLRMTDVIASLGAALPGCAFAGNPVLAYGSHEIDDSIGNADGVADPFEILTLPVTLKNVGTGVASGAVGTLSSSTPGVTILDGGATWQNLASGLGRGSDPPHFQVRLADTIPCGTVVQFSLNVAADQGSWVIPFEQVVGQPAVATGTFAATDTPKSIPDNNAAGATSVISVPDSFPIGDITVSVNIAHTRIGDLQVDLTSPSGTIVRLHNNTGGQADDIVTTYDTLTAPDGPGTMADFDGEPIGGTWSLKAADTANNQVGQINSWSIDATEGGTPVCSPVPCFVTPQAAAAPASICQGQSTTVSGAGSTEFGQDCSGVLEYRFELGGVVLQDWSTDLDAVVVPPQSTVYTVRVRDQATLAEDAAFASVSASPAPPPAVQQTPQPTCVEYDSLTLDAGPGYASYVWRDDASQVVGTAPMLSLDGAACGRTYTITATTAAGCVASTPHAVVCPVCTPAEVSPPGSAVPFRMGLDAAGTIEFGLLPDGDVQYHVWIAQTIPALLAGDYAFRICDLENNAFGTFTAVDPTTARWTPATPAFIVPGNWVVIAERLGFEGSYGSASDGTPRPHDLDGSAPAELGCP